MHEEIVVTIYRPAANAGILGVSTQEDTWSVPIERGATIGQLRARIEELYSVPRHQQLVRREIQGTVLPDDEPLRCVAGDVLVMDVAAFSNPFGAGLTEAFSTAMADVVRLGQEAQDALQATTIRLNFVLPEGQQPRSPEKRCVLEVSATAKLTEVLQMAAVEMAAEGAAKGLQFAGNVLPLQAAVMMSGLQDGDTVIVTRS